MTMFPSGKCVVFGGHSKSDKFYNSVHIFNYGTSTTLSLRLEFLLRLCRGAWLAGDMTWKKLDRAEGDIPTPRGGHSAVAYNNELIIFGGFDGKKHYNDIHALDIGMFSLLSLRVVLPSSNTVGRSCPQSAACGARWPSTAARQPGGAATPLLSWPTSTSWSSAAARTPCSSTTYMSSSSTP